ncbi:MAG: type II toxin-antitoxin system VapC family toxin [Candidatus Omnitrophica bacterium]|nr:type II toxin-antitoxin system VapC family toxin [Candidatus Omnitrophota bacterium]
MSNNPKNKTKYLLLDTHIWIWLLNGSEELNDKKYLSLINQYASHELVRISAISVWEIGMLVAKKRISLSKDVTLWVKESFKGYGLFLEPLSIDVMLDSTQLGDSFHGDPADRMIIATAKNINAAIMTADEKINNYCKTHGLAVEFIKK